MEKYGSIDQFTEDELREQLKKINAVKADTLMPTKRPGILYNAKEIAGHFNKLIDEAEKIIDSIMEGNYCVDNDNETWIYEAAMESIYGPGIWDWINTYTD